LEAVADIEYVDNLDSLIQRVSGTDSIAGIYMDEGKIRLMVEGNESADFAESRKKLVAAALGSESTVYVSEPIEGKSSMAYEISMACIFLLALFIGGSSLGLSGVAERESGVIRAYRISPMTLWGYILSKIIPAVLLGVVSVAACALVMGGAKVLPQFVLMTLCSTLVCGMIAFVIIAFADNQIAAVGVLKIVMPLFLAVGISAAFIPENLLAVYYPLPMYWQYAAISSISAGQPAMFELLMILATSIPWFIAVLIIFTKKGKLKGRR